MNTKHEKDIYDDYAAYDVLHIPEKIENMSLAEIEAELAKYEKETKDNNDKKIA